MTITIHAIFNAHLDPVWMWPWTAGLDEALATSRSACDRLDAHPELFYTQGEAWILAMVERADPGLFQRIQGHVADGRWEIVNGWWLQPDCNFPTAESLRRQIQMGLDWIGERFDVQPRTGFNPDSFGHCAILPDILREHGQDRYVFMRPQPHEMRLPARLFAWRTTKTSKPVTTFRIAESYMNGVTDEIWMGSIRNAVQDLPPGCTHTMSFFGVGDHGGGPTERLVRWVKENPEIVPGTRLVFSTINRFFDAVEQERPKLPTIVGELQMHAIGCYTVVRNTKVALRRAEHSLARAAAVATPAEQAELTAPWRAVLAHQFHDTAGGAAIPEAYTFVDAQLGGAAAAAEEMTAYAIRRQMQSLPADPRPRLVLANPGAQPFDGWAAGTLYLEGFTWVRGPWRLVDAQGREVPFQAVPTGAGISPDWFWNLRRVLVNIRIPANGLGVLHLDLSKPPAKVPPQVTTHATGVRNRAGSEVQLDSWRPVLKKNGRTLGGISLHLLDDPSDTWSHGINRFAEGPFEEPVWQPPQVQDTGPWMASILQNGTIGQSRLAAEWRVYGREPWVELLLEVLWTERMKVLKLVLPGSDSAARIDGTPGMALERANDGKERPLQDYTALGRHAVVCPDCFALDATPQRARLTLLRSPFMAHHEPQGYFPAAVVADQGRHRFRFRFFLAKTAPAVLAEQARQLQEPPLTAELTRGMPARWTEYRTATDIRR